MNHSHYLLMESTHYFKDGASSMLINMSNVSTYNGSLPPYNDGMNGSFKPSDFNDNNNNNVVYPTRSNAKDCKHYLEHGTCFYGANCKFNHPKNKMLKTINVAKELNDIGLPLRLDKENCPFYMKSGKCSYGKTCQFNHPDYQSIKDMIVSSSYNDTHQDHQVNQSISSSNAIIDDASVRLLFFLLHFIVCLC